VKGREGKGKEEGEAGEGKGGGKGRRGGGTCVMALEGMDPMDAPAGLPTALSGSMNIYEHVNNLVRVRQTTDRWQHRAYS